MKHNFIDFPKNEHIDYIGRLNQGKIIYTTRVSNEVGKYKLNQIYNSPFGTLKVCSYLHFIDITEHPFLKELTKEQIETIKKYISEYGCDLIGLERVE